MASASKAKADEIAGAASKVCPSVVKPLGQVCRTHGVGAAGTGLVYDCSISDVLYLECPSSQNGVAA